jgi:hypothetical protein
MSFMIQLSTSNRRKESRYRSVNGYTCTSSCLQSNIARGMSGGGGGLYILSRAKYVQYMAQYTLARAFAWKLLCSICTGYRVPVSVNRFHQQQSVRSIIQNQCGRSGSGEDRLYFGGSESVGIHFNQI